MRNHARQKRIWHLTWAAVWLVFAVHVAATNGSVVVAMAAVVCANLWLATAGTP